MNKSSVKNSVEWSRGSADASELESSESGRSTVGDKIRANQIDDADDDDDDDRKTNVNPKDLDVDSNVYEDVDDVNVDGDASDGDDNGNDDDDINYDGDKISASESIVIKLGSKSSNGKTKGTNAKPPKSVAAVQPSTTTTTTTTTASAVTASNVNSFNDDYYSKDDMSVYDDVNNNRLNLRNANGHVNAYEQRNIYVANELSDGATANANESVKSYIHIEVYKGNLDDLTTRRTTKPPPTTTTTTTSTSTMASPTTVTAASEP